MELQVRENGKIRILDLDGNLTIGREDLVLREKFRSFLHDGHTLFLLNLEKVSYIDSSGLGEIVACKKRAVEKGGDVKLLNPNPRVHELFHLSKLTEIFQIFQDETEAINSF